MTNDNTLRLQFLVRVIGKESKYLQQTASRLFSQPVDARLLATLESNIDLSEQLDAFASRFGRLQDNIGDKLLPATLAALGEKTGPVLDNLNKAEKYGWLSSADNWLVARQLRNKMVHEYIEDPAILAEAINAARQFISLLQDFATALTAALTDRKLI
ncbi:hypothetical protein [Arsukibacterium indicum]|uniref:Toxin-antitoxin antitoxin component n=1 Tax=Arsukibacterium indicum TaxID=2848612 RepID=A0ABS6MPD2_9GAMM|nr:hypothetical protein [Arsukibacterium indicum]MBV2130585.1 hypothetical protein [Arsukibacterium indicum]